MSYNPVFYYHKSSSHETRGQVHSKCYVKDKDGRTIYANMCPNMDDSIKLYNEWRTKNGK